MLPTTRISSGTASPAWRGAPEDPRRAWRAHGPRLSTTRPLARSTVTVAGVPVLALACDLAAPALAVPCASTDHGTWRALLGTRRQESRVMAQVDLS